MNKLNLKKSIRVVAVSGFMLSLATLMFNCGGKQFRSAGNDETSSASVTTPGAFDKPSSPYAQMTAEQQFNSMLNVTGQAAPSGTMKAEYILRQGSLADNDNLAGVTAPLLMASTSLAGEVCNGLLSKEKAMAAASRTFFQQVDFNQTIAANSAAGYSASAEALAQALYGRSLSAEEQAILVGFYTEFNADLTAAQAAQPAQTGALYLSLCSGMLASYDSMTY